MKFLSSFLVAISFMLSPITSVRAWAASDDLFTVPTRGFVSSEPAKDWEQGIITGNGTMGAIVLGQPFAETLYLSHAALYLPQPNSARYINMASRLEKIRQLCFAGEFRAAGDQIVEARKEYSYDDQRDPFIAAFTLGIKQPEAKVVRYQRTVDWMTAETVVSVEGGEGSFRRSAFVSRPDNVIVLRLAGGGKQSAEFSFAALPPINEKEKKVIAEGIKSSEQGVKEGLLYFRTLFAHGNPFNPNLGYEGLGKVISKGGQRAETAAGIKITDADEIIVLVKIQPLAKTAKVNTDFAAIRKHLDALVPDYVALLVPQAKVQGDLMSRVSFSLDVPENERAKSSEQLNQEAKQLAAPLAKIERAFDAGRYNIICSTGLYPPNLMGLWSGTWLAPWSGSFTTDGNLPAAVSFDLMGNTPELMEPFFRYYDERWDGFRENAKAFFGTRGFHVPGQLTLSPRETDFNPRWPLCYWHAGAAWALNFYYDYYQYTGDLKFLAERAYPLMKEATEFYEDFLAITDKNGKVVFAPSYSTENSPGNEEKEPATTINATMDFAAAKQLLRNSIAAAKILGRDADLQKKWADLIAKMPAYEIGPEGSFREWLWPGLPENNRHRHASHFYELYDGMPPEIVDNPALVKAVEHSIGERLIFLEETGEMAFGIVQNGLAAAHVGNAELTQRVVNFLAKYYWSSGMASFHNRGELFNMDISGGFPYLCASALVYSVPGKVRFFPARPAQWTRGSLKGVRLRGGIVLRDLSWDGPRAQAVLVSDTDQTVMVEQADGKAQACTLHAGVATVLNF
jgi:alpha-L-fucosidase 2